MFALNNTREHYENMIYELNQIGWLMGNKVVSVLPGRKKGVIKQTKVTF